MRMIIRYNLFIYLLIILTLILVCVIIYNLNLNLIFYLIVVVIYNDSYFIPYELKKYNFNLIFYY